MIAKTIPLAAALTAALVAQPALAGTIQNEAATRITTVSYADLDLGTRAGRDELNKRLAKATIKVCRFDAEGRLVTSEAENACARAARADIRTQLAQIDTEQRFAESSGKNNHGG